MWRCESVASLYNSPPHRRCSVFTSTMRMRSRRTERRAVLSGIRLETQNNAQGPRQQSDGPVKKVSSCPPVVTEGNKKPCPGSHFGPEGGQRQRYQCWMVNRDGRIRVFG
ncbi:hypothetical protein RB213_013311 [Colletotrichum asianum]